MDTNVQVSNSAQIAQNGLLPAVYSMKLHETITVGEDMYATRVPGGWIYEIQKPQVNVLETVFVPFNNEFMPG